MALNRFAARRTETSEQEKTPTVEQNVEVKPSLNRFAPKRGTTVGADNSVSDRQKQGLDRFSVNNDRTARVDAETPKRLLTEKELIEASGGQALMDYVSKGYDEMDAYHDTTHNSYEAMVKAGRNAGNKPLSEVLQTLPVNGGIYKKYLELFQTDEQRRRTVQSEDISIHGNKVVYSRRMDEEGISEAYKDEHPDYKSLAKYLTEDEVDYYSYLYAADGEASAELWYKTMETALQKRKNQPESEWVSHNPIHETDRAGVVAAGREKVDFETLDKGNALLPSYMTEKEKDQYAYTYEKFGKDEADGYYNTIRGVLYNRYLRSEVERVNGDLKLLPQGVKNFLTSGGSIVDVLAGSPVAAVGDAAEYVFKGKIDPYNSNNLVLNMGQEKRDYVGDQIKNKTLRTVYDIGMSGLDTAASILVSGGIGEMLGGTATAVNAITKAANTALMSSRSFATTVKNAKERGVDDGKAVTLGLLSAAIEGVTEEYSLDKLLKNPGAIWNIAIANASEEVSANLLNWAADVIVTGDESEWRQRIDQYVADGASEEEALSCALVDKAKELGIDALGGFAIGGMLSLPGTISNASAQHSLQGKVEAALTKSGIDAKTAAALAKPMSKAVVQDYRMTDAELDLLSQNPTAQALMAEMNDTFAAAKAEAQAQAAVTASERGVDARALQTVTMEPAIEVPSQPSRLSSFVGPLAKPPSVAETDTAPSRADSIFRLAPDGNIQTAESPTQLRKWQTEAKGAESPVLQSTATNEGGNDNGRVFDGDEERHAGMGAGGEGGSLRGGTEPTDATADTGSQRAVLADLLSDRGVPLQSTRSFGITRGTDSLLVKEVPADMWDDAMRATDAQVYNITGKHVRFVVGQMQIQTASGTRNIRGVRTDNGIVVQANHPYLTAEKIAAHETFHELCALYPQLYAQAMAKIEERYPDQASRQAVITRYTEELTGIYGNDEIAIMEEILADAYAGINAFGVDASMYHDVVSGAVEDALGQGRAVAADLPTRAPPATASEMRLQETEDIDALTKRLFGETEQTPSAFDGMSNEEIFRDIVSKYDESDPTAQKNTADVGGERYSIERDANGKVFVDVTEDVLDPNSGESVARTIQRVLSERFGNVIVANGQRIQVNQKTSREFRNSESARGVAKQSVQMYNDKLRTLANADEIVAAARNWIGEELKHTRTDDIVEFARGKVTYRVGQNGYVADVIVGTRKNGAAVLYDIKNIYTTKIVESSGYYGRQSAPNAAQMTSTTGTISQLAADVNPEKYSADDKDVPQYHSPYGIYMPGTPGVSDGSGDASMLHQYTYEALVQKPPVEVVVIKERNIPTKGKKLDTSAIINEGLRRASLLESDTGSQRYVYNSDIRANIAMPKGGLVHGILGNKTNSGTLNTAQITYYLPDVLRNSIAINELNPRTVADGEYSYVLIGYCESEEGNGYIVRSTVNHFGSSRAAVDSVEIYDVLKGAKSKKTEAQVMRRYSGFPAAIPANAWTSTISVAELLDIVKNNYPKFLSQSVREHYGLDVMPYDGVRYSVDEPFDFLDEESGGESGVPFAEEELSPAERMRAQLRMEHIPPKPDTAGRSPAGMNVDEYTAQLTARAEKAKQERLRVPSKEEFKGSEAMEVLGIKVAGTVTSYDDAEYLRQADNADKALKRDIAKLEHRLAAKPKEKDQARMLAEGRMTINGIDPSARAWVVQDLSEMYANERAMGENVIRRQKHKIFNRLDEWCEELFADVSLDTFKDSPKELLNIRTPLRNVRSLFGDEKAPEVYSELFENTWHNTVEGKRFKQRMFDAVRTFSGADGKVAELTETERAVAMIWLEGRAVEDSVAGMRTRERVEAAAHNLLNGMSKMDVIANDNLSVEEFAVARRMAWWKQAQQWVDEQTFDITRVDNAIVAYTEMYGKLYEALNDFLAVHGYEQIGFMKGYAPHFQSEKVQNAMVAFLKSLGRLNDQEVAELPTSIAGLTGEFKPGHRWDPFMQHRSGEKTEYDIARGYEQYIDYIADVFYHTDDIMRLRRAVRYFRTEYAAENIREEISQIKALRYASFEEKAAWLKANKAMRQSEEIDPETVSRLMDEYLEKEYKNVKVKSKFARFVTWMEDYANTLAGKQTALDRGDEAEHDRPWLNLSGHIVSAFAKTNIAGNLSSALNQVSQLPAVLNECGPVNVAHAMWDMLQHNRNRQVHDDSDFLTGKQSVKGLTDTKMDAMYNAMYKPIEWVDRFVSCLAVDARYYQLRAKGTDSKAALKQADRFAANVMGSRVKGEKPQWFLSRNIVRRMIGFCQVEATNIVDHYLSDLPAEIRHVSKTRGKGAARWMIVRLSAGHLLWGALVNWLIGMITGGSPAPFDLVGIIGKGIKAGWGGDDEEFDWNASFKEMWYNISNDIPLFQNISALLGLGDSTLPYPQVVPAVKGTWEAIREKGLFSGEAAEGAFNVITQAIPAGRQLRKTAQGIDTMAKGGVYSGYGDDRRLQYPVDGTWDEWIRAVMFGKSALSETDEYYTSGASGLSAKQTQVYESVVDMGADREAVYDTIQAIRSAESGRDARDVLAAADLTDAQKVEVYKGMISGDHTDAFVAMMDAGMAWNKVMEIYNALEELEPESGKKSVSNKQRYAAVAEMDLSDEEGKAALSLIITGDAYEKMEVACEYGATPKQWARYYAAADKDGNGTISQLEAGVWLKDMVDLTSKQRAALWQTTNKGWDPRSNPFDKSLGFKVQEALKGAEEEK